MRLTQARTASSVPSSASFASVSPNPNEFFDLYTKIPRAECCKVTDGDSDYSAVNLIDTIITGLLRVLRRYHLYVVF